MKNIKIAGMKFVKFEDMLAELKKKPGFKKGYEEEFARLRLVRQIRELRIAKKMTQKTLAAKAEMPQSVIARIESGEHSFTLATLTRLARAFNKEIHFA